MSTPVALSSTKVPEHELTPAARTLEHRSSSPPPSQGGRWWFVFDRWLAVTDVADGQDEFVMA